MKYLYILFYYAKNLRLYAADESEENIRRSLPQPSPIQSYGGHSKPESVQRSPVRSWKAWINEVGFLLRRIPLRNYGLKAVVASFFSFFSITALNKDFILPVGSTEIDIFKIHFDGRSVSLYEKDRSYNAKFSDKPFVQYSNFESGPYLVAGKLVFVRKDRLGSSLFVYTFKKDLPFCESFLCVRQGSVRISDDGKKLEFGLVGICKPTVVDLCE